ncbi:AI-2E family transporter, partial [Flavobacterium sp. IR1]
MLGKLILIGLLAVVYYIGLGISGVSNFILVSIIEALLTLIPYFGNIIGLSLAMAFGYLTSGELGVLIGVLITFTVSQFLESYVLQPYVVGDKVDLHPFTVIVVVVLGGALWGVIGM